MVAWSQVVQGNKRKTEIRENLVKSHFNFTQVKAQGVSPFTLEGMKMKEENRI